MKKIVLSLLFVIGSFNLYAQTAGGGIGPSQITRPPLGKPPEKLGPKPSTDIKPQVKPEPKPQFTSRPVFTQPGIVAIQGGGFVGTDHLYNVSSSIPVVVNIIKSEGLQVLVVEDRIQQLVESVFTKEGIDINVKPSSGPPLPFFQILVMIVPSGEGVSAFCSGRLFEKVSLDRVILPHDVSFQAITWEYQNLIYASREDMSLQIEGVVNEIAQEFLSRYKYYKAIK